MCFNKMSCSIGSYLAFKEQPNDKTNAIFRQKRQHNPIISQMLFLERKDSGYLPSNRSLSFSLPKTDFLRHFTQVSSE